MKSAIRGFPLIGRFTMKGFCNYKIVEDVTETKLLCRWSKNRTITSLDWSPQFPELLLASYNANEESPNDPDGVVLVWNTKFKKTTPEYIFHCQSAVLSTTFAR